MRRPHVPRGGLWANPDFVKLWTGQTISEFGSPVSALAIPWLAAKELNASPFEFSLLGVLGFLPFILFALPAGVWVDRLRRRPILIIGDASRAVLLAWIPIAWLLGILTIWQLFVARVRRRDLHGLLRRRVPVVSPLARRAGPADGRELEAPDDGVGGADRGAGPRRRADRGAHRAVRDPRRRRELRRLDALHDPDPPRREAAGAGGGRAEAEDAARAEGGPRYVVQHRYLKWIAACTGSSNFFGSIAFAIGVLYMARTLHMSSLAAGVVIGAASGSARSSARSSTTRFQKAVGVGRAISIPAMFFSFAGFSFPLAPQASRCRCFFSARCIVRLRRHGVQHHAGQPPPGDHARAAAGADERVDALDRLGHDAARLARRRRDRDDVQHRDGALGRGDRRHASRSCRSSSPRWRRSA